MLLRNSATPLLRIPLIKDSLRGGISNISERHGSTRTKAATAILTQYST